MQAVKRLPSPKRDSGRDRCHVVGSRLRSGKILPLGVAGEDGHHGHSKKVSQPARKAKSKISALEEGDSEPTRSRLIASA